MPPFGGFLVFGVSYCRGFCRGILLTPKEVDMNGIGLLITVGFCTIIWWGTSSYYKAIIKTINKSWEEKLRFEQEAIWKDNR